MVGAPARAESMSLIVTEVYEALLFAGVPDDKAKAAAGAIPAARDIAGKDDIAELQAATLEKIAKLHVATQQDIAELRASTQEKIAKLEVSTQQSIANLQASTQQSIAELRASTLEKIAESQELTRQEIAKSRESTQLDIAKMQREIVELRSSMTFMKFVYGPTVIVLLLKLVFFP